MLSLFYIWGTWGFRGAKYVLGFHTANNKKNWDLKTDPPSLPNCGLSTSFGLEIQDNPPSSQYHLVISGPQNTAKLQNNSVRMISRKRYVE